MRMRIITLCLLAVVAISNWSFKKHDTNYYYDVHFTNASSNSVSEMYVRRGSFPLFNAQPAAAHTAYGDTYTHTAASAFFSCRLVSPTTGAYLRAYVNQTMTAEVYIDGNNTEYVTGAQAVDGDNVEFILSDN